MYKDNWTQLWPVGSKIYPEIHENPRAFFRSSSPILLEPLAHGSSDWSLPREDCITFLRERRAQLREGEYTEFQEKVARRQWTQLTKPMGKYDSKIVMEFYANALPTEEGVMDKRSQVWGQWISYDEDVINQFLGHPLVLEEGQHCEYTERKSQVSGFDEEAIG